MVLLFGSRTRLLLLSLNKHTVATRHCNPPASSPSQPYPPYRSLPVFRSIQTSILCKEHPSSRSLDLKCDLLRQEGLSPAQIQHLQDVALFRSVRLENVASVVSFLRSKGIEGPLAGRVMTRTPTMFAYTVKCLERKCKFLEDIGLGTVGVQRILMKMQYGFVLSNSTEGLQKRIDFLERIGLKRKDVLKIIVQYPHVLLFSIIGKMEPTLAFFERHGMSKEFLCKLVVARPQILGSSVQGKLKSTMEFLRRLGLNIDSNKGTRAFGCWITVTSQGLLSRWKFLTEYGFSDCDICKMVKLQPALLVKSTDSLRRKINYCRNVLNRDIGQMVRYPCFLSQSLEKRIIPRFAFLKEEKERNERTMSLSLSTLFAPTDETFDRRYGPGYIKWKARYASENRADV